MGPALLYGYFVSREVSDAKEENSKYSA